MERAARQGLGAHDIAVQNDSAARDSIGADHLFQINDPLPRQNHAFENPIQRAAVKNLIAALGPHAGDMRRRARAIALRLPFQQVFDTLRAHA